MQTDPRYKQFNKKINLKEKIVSQLTKKKNLSFLQQDNKITYTMLLKRQPLRSWNNCIRRAGVSEEG